MGLSLLSSHSDRGKEETLQAMMASGKAIPGIHHGMSWTRPLRIGDTVLHSGTQKSIESVWPCWCCSLGDALLFRLENLCFCSQAVDYCMGTFPFVPIVVFARQSRVGTQNLFAFSLLRKKDGEMATNFHFSGKRPFCFSLQRCLERKHISVNSAEQQCCPAG